MTNLNNTSVVHFFYHLVGQYPGDQIFIGYGVLIKQKH